MEVQAPITKLPSEFSEAEIIHTIAILSAELRDRRHIVQSPSLPVTAQDSPSALPATEVIASGYPLSIRPNYYSYQPLRTPKSIRLIKLLPGKPEGDIHITIHHGTLSDISDAAAASYEWGEKIRWHKVFCGGQILKVTRNLVQLLQSLRSTGFSEYLWIDALCINQDDLDERAQQVPLMVGIYQNAAVVFIWIGQELHFTREACRTIVRIAKRYDSWSRSVRDRIRYGPWFNNPSEIPEGEMLVTLEKEPYWSDVMDLLSARSYFRRLWVVQEIVLSSNAVVICGECQVDWVNFHKAAEVIWSCETLGNTAEDDRILTNVASIGNLRREGRTKSLLNLIQDFRYLQCSDPRDRVFGLLGMLHSGPLKDSIQIDYKRAVEEVYQQVTSSVVTHEQSLSFFERINLEPGIRYTVDVASWTLRDQPRLWLVPHIDWIRDNIHLEDRLSVLDNILTAYGLVLDVIEEVSDNFFHANFKSHIVSLFTSQLVTMKKAEIQDIESAARQTLLFLWPRGEKLFDEQSFLILLARWVTSYFKHTQIPKEQNSNPAACKGALEKSNAGNTMRSATSSLTEYSILDWALQYDQGNYPLPAEDDLTFNLFDPNEGCGRVIFRSQTGLRGLGPLGSTAPGSSPAVQVGDCIAILATVNIPLILRPVGDGYHALIGTAYVGNLDEHPLLKEVNPGLVPIQLR